MYPNNYHKMEQWFMKNVLKDPDKNKVHLPEKTICIKHRFDFEDMIHKPNRFDFIEDSELFNARL